MTSSSSLVNDLTIDFTSSTNASSNDFKQKGDKLVVDLMEEIEKCYDSKKSVHDSKRLQELVQKVALLGSLYREAAKDQ